MLDNRLDGSLHVNRGDYMQTYSGEHVYPNSPYYPDFNIEDIARALSNMCRFNGHVREFYSVAQHSVLGARQAPKRLKKAFLLHDGSEGFIADIVRPAKVSLPDYLKMETGIEIAIAARFGTAWPMDPLVKVIDNRMLITEASQLLNPDLPPEKRWWTQGDYKWAAVPFDIKITPWSPTKARKAFLNAFYRYEAL